MEINDSAVHAEAQHFAAVMGGLDPAELASFQEYADTMRECANSMADIGADELGYCAPLATPGMGAGRAVEAAL